MTNNTVRILLLIGLNTFDGMDALSCPPFVNVDVNKLIDNQLSKESFEELNEYFNIKLDKFPNGDLYYRFTFKDVEYWDDYIKNKM